MPPSHPNTESRHGLPPIYPVEAECWSCGQTVQGDPTAALRRCEACDVSWKVGLLPARSPAEVAQGIQPTGYGHPNRPWNQLLRSMRGPWTIQREGD